ncbi:MAG: hypothetical protein ACRC2K_12650 [Clostridium sp.]
MRVLENGIEVFGVSEDIELKSKYFKEFDFQFNNPLERVNKEISSILGVNIVIKKGDVSIVKTPIMASNEGVYLSGYKLKVELIIDMKVKYILNTPLPKLTFNNNKILKTIYVVLPLEHNGENMIDLLRKRRIIISTFVEDVFCELNEDNILYSNVSAIVCADFID